MIFDYQFNKAIIEEFKRYGITLPMSTHLRFVRVELETGEIEVLLTEVAGRNKFWKGDLPFEVTREKGRLKFSLFSILLRLGLIAAFVWYVFFRT